MNASTFIPLALLAAGCVADVGRVGDGDDDPADDGTCSTERYHLDLTTEADLDDIPEGCFDLDGDLTIRRSTLTDLTRLEGLRSVRSLIVEDNAQLATFDGLYDVEVKDELRIEGNPRLADLDGLTRTEQLTLVRIADNPALRDLDGLSSLARLDGDLVLDNNAALASVAALSKVTSAANVLIEDNPALRDLAGIRLATVTGDLQLRRNGLRAIAGVSTLVRVDGRLVIDDNDQLGILDGFSPGLAIGTNLEITNNAALSSVLPLYRAQVVGASLVVTGNPALTQCRADDLQDCVPVLGLRTITANGPSWDPCDQQQCADPQ